jgi:hypothetical protein
MNALTHGYEQFAKYPLETLKAILVSEKTHN